MSTLAKLSKQAVQLEHDRQYEKALALYARMFDEAAGAEEEVDIVLFNRAGDLAMRLGDSARAVSYYERAIDAYAGGGLLNNAIAVCNKVLRQAPDHAATHYTLAVLHAKQGFRGDAKHHYVEYAERMHRAGRDDEALRALGEFAALCPVGDDARTLLARHLAKGNRGTEISARLEAMLADVPGAAPAQPAQAAAPAAAASVMPAAADLGGALVFLDVSLESAEPEPVAALAGLELTTLADAAPAPALDLDLSAEPWLDAAPADLAPLDLDDAVAVAGPSAVAPRWSSELPGELPALSLAGWIGSASPAVIADAPEIVDDLLTLAEPRDVPFDAPLDLSLVGAFDASPAFDDVELPFVTDVDEPEPLAVESIALPLLADAPSALELPDALATLALATPALATPALATPAGATPTVAAPSAFVDLGDWLRAAEPAPSTRITMEDAAPTGDERADFERLLGAFKLGIARNVDAEDYASHYDLGVAFREMGLVDEAIAEFQRAARAPSGALRAREALGQCFLDRGSADLALATLERALRDDAPRDALDELSLVGVMYLLGEAHERLGHVDSARACYQRVVAADIEFRDASRRLTQLSAQTP